MKEFLFFVPGGRKMIRKIANLYCFSSNRTDLYPWANQFSVGVKENHSLVLKLFIGCFVNMCFNVLLRLFMKHCQSSSCVNRIHTGERPCQCCHCIQSFQICNNLKRHKGVHTGERPFQCFFGYKDTVVESYLVVY